MSALVGVVATGCVLGVTHAVEPDHVAGISSLTSEYGDARRSGLVGACFGIGHVVLVAVWLGGASLLLGDRTLEGLDPIGTAIVAAALGVLGGAMVIRGLRSVVHRHEHDHGDGAHSHVHVHLPFVGTSHAHDHGHGVRAYLKTGIVGALFTLSPPLTMMVFATSVLPSHGTEAVVLSVAAYAVGIATTMALIGAGVGAAFGSIAERPGALGVARAAGGALVVGLAGWMLVGAVA